MLKTTKERFMESKTMPNYKNLLIWGGSAVALVAVLLVIGLLIG